MSAIVDILTSIGDLISSFFTSIASIGSLLSNGINFISQFFVILPGAMIPGITGTLLVAICYKIIGRDS